MSVSIEEFVDRTIRHARRMDIVGLHEWPTARSALTKILADLERRSPDEPSLERLRRFIARGDRAWKARRRERK